MKAGIGLMTVLANVMEELANFYSSVLGFEKNYITDDCVEFESEGVRFARCARSTLHRLSNHEAYRGNQGVNLLSLHSLCPVLRLLTRVIMRIIQDGATPIREPHDMPWIRRTAMFADPEGNIHELYGPRTDE